VESEVICQRSRRYLAALPGSEGFIDVYGPVGKSIAPQEQRKQKKRQQGYPTFIQGLHNRFSFRLNMDVVIVKLALQQDKGIKDLQ
jgi:hypothetical protein